jgi:outer membrane protein assembly factor BamB
LEDNLVVDCLDATTGTKHWTFRRLMQFTDGAHFDSGPRSTPTIKDGRVFAFNTDGYLVCLDLKTGEKLWSRHVKSEFKSSATWHGCVASPLVTDKAVILTVGGTNSAGVVALARDTGKTLWQAFDEKASAASPVLAVLHGKPRVLAVTRSALHCFDPDTGADAWSLPTRRQSSGNVYAASPVVVGDQVWLSGWYELGALWLRAKPDGVEQLWHRDDAISTHYANVVIHQGHAYGFHGHAMEGGGPNLRCVELATGKVVWEQPQTGSGTLIRAGDNLLILTDRGQLQLAKASPVEFKIKCRAQVVTPFTRSYPAIADGYVYVKGPRKLVCVDLRAQSGLGKP